MLEEGVFVAALGAANQLAPLHHQLAYIRFSKTGRAVGTQRTSRALRLRGGDAKAREGIEQDGVDGTEALIEGTAPRWRGHAVGDFAVVQEGATAGGAAHHVHAGRGRDGWVKA